jgi:hypothetical protein
VDLPYGGDGGIVAEGKKDIELVILQDISKTDLECMHVYRRVGILYDALAEARKARGGPPSVGANHNVATGGAQCPDGGNRFSIICRAGCGDEYPHDFR